MTLVLALACKDGLVVASDSQATFPMATQHVRLEEEKLFQLSSAPIVWGGSGQIGMQQDIAIALRDLKKDDLKKSIEKLRFQLANKVRPVLKQAKEQYIEIDPRVSRPVAHTLICGHTDGRFWILEIDPNGMVEQHEHRGFAAIGSAAEFAYYAYVSLKHHDVPQRRLCEGQVLAYRTIWTAIQVTAYGLAEPVRMWIINKDGAFRVSEGDMTVIGHAVDLCKKKEVEDLIGVTATTMPEGQIE